MHFHINHNYIHSDVKEKSQLYEQLSGCMMLIKIGCYQAGIIPTARMTSPQPGGVIMVMCVDSL